MSASDKPTGLSRAEPDGLGPPGFDPSRATVGEWIVRKRFSRWSWAQFEAARLIKVTAKQAIVMRYREERWPLDEIVVALPSAERAQQLVQALGGVLGTYRQKAAAIDSDCGIRKRAAAEVADKAASRLIASAIETEGGDAQQAPSRSDESATAESGDAQ